MTENKDKSLRVYEKPVAWLLGQQLLGGLKGIFLYAAYGEKLDPRDWMTAQPISFEDKSKTEFWFDYLADAGDGTKAMYSIAYLAMSSLWTRLQPGTTSLPTSESDREVSTLNDAAKPFTFSLPRGEFLFVGGDTSYHAAEYLTLVDRIQNPFRYAYEDLRDRKLISDVEPPRPIFGIPGNHDYYDQIDGFRRQFRKPTRREGPLPPKSSGANDAQLTVPGFKRVQEASYVAIHLPFEWWLWGLDTESVTQRANQNLDRRQEEFFKNSSSAAGGPPLPDKLILATCSPSTVLGKTTDEDDRKVVRPQHALKLSQPFLPARTNGKLDLSETGDPKLTTGQIRLDLSGDVHHYARYWGPAAPAGEAPRAHNTAPQPAAKSYASVVSGSGGAFHHPSATYDDEICEQVLYPAEAKSREAVAHRLFKFWKIMRGGYVWLAGFILAFTIYFGVTVPQSSRQFISNVGFLNRLEFDDIAKNEPIKATVVQPGTQGQPCDSVKPFALWTRVGLVSEVWPPPAGCRVEAPTYFFPNTTTLPLDVLIGDIFIFLAFVASTITLCLALFTRKIFGDANPFASGNNLHNKLLAITLGVGVLVYVGLFTIQPYHRHITPFMSSLIVLFCMYTAMTAVVLNVRYNDYLFKKTFVASEKKGWAAWWERKVDYYLPWLLWLGTVLVAACGLWLFGRNNLPAYLVSDVAFLVVLIAGTLGILVLPFKVAGDLLYTKSKPIQIVGKALIGIWHLILQLLVPYILIRNGNYFTWIAAALLVVLPIPLAQFLLKKNSRLGLSLLWLAYGAVMLNLPWITRWGLDHLNWSSVPVFVNTTGWWGLVPSVLAGVFGAVICCLWTGWYFAVCFIFNGHNNEVGGAARIEEFKQFIRFRLTNEGLTGYVIAIDDVSKVGEVEPGGHFVDGSDLNARLIDVFHLVPKSP
jgi:hypothetical protein